MKSHIAFTPSAELLDDLKELDGESFTVVGNRLRGRIYQLGEQGQTLEFVHIQGSTGAEPASVLRVTLLPQNLALLPGDLQDPSRRLAVFDFLLREFVAAVAARCRPNRGDEGSGTFQVPQLPQQILRRNVWQVLPDGRLAMLVRISLPGRRPALLLAAEARAMIADELPRVLSAVATEVRSRQRLEEHIAAVQDFEAIAGELDDRKLVAFIPDGARLPRRSGHSDLPADPDRVVAFRAPDQRRITISLPGGRSVSGLGIPQGVTVIVGGGFHGKSTVLAALARCVYPHIPGDGRERVVTDATAVLLHAEEGRAVRSVDISPFIRNLPDGSDTRNFRTDNASGSTSQAAGLVEAIWAGARVLLLDEDTSATNFLVRDPLMRRLVPHDPITPLLFHARALYEHHGVSSVLVSGSNSQFLGIADCVIEMRRWRPVDATDRARQLAVSPPTEQPPSLTPADPRILAADNFSPDYHDAKRGKTVPQRIKPLRGAWRILEYGDEQVDLQRQDALVDPDQVLCIGRALCHARALLSNRRLSPSALAAELAATDLADLQSPRFLYLAAPRRLELAAAINRLRNLAVTLG